MAKDITIKDKQKTLFRTSMVSIAMSAILLTYLMLNVDVYMFEHKRATLFEAIQAIPDILSKNPMYFWPLPIGNDGFNINATGSIVSIVVLLQVVAYSYNKLRLHHDINTLKGSSAWANLQELVRKYAAFEPDGKKWKTAFQNVIMSSGLYISQACRVAMNVLVIGMTGSGKSRFVVKPNLLQMNASYIVTDPKGGILNEVGEAMRRNGYTIKVVDLIKMGECNSYNPMKYCYKESDIKKLVQAFIKNSDLSAGAQKKSADPFWDDSMNAFLCACVGFLVGKPSHVDGKEDDLRTYAQIPEIIGSDNAFAACFATLCEMTRMANRKWTPNCGITKYKGTELGDGKNNTANASELAQIFENLRAWEAERQGVEPDLMEKPYCLHEWENFKLAPEKTSTTILMTTAVKMDAFNIEQVKNLTSTDNLDLDKFGTKKEVLFIITPVGDKTYNFLVAFLYTQLFELMFDRGTNKTIGSTNLLLPNGDLVHHWEIGEATEDEIADKIKALKSAKAIEAEGSRMLKGKKKVKKKMFKFFGPEKTVTESVDFFDGWYDIVDANGELVSRRPDKKTADKFVADLKNVVKKGGSGIELPMFVRCLMDEFPTTAEVPEFKEKLALVRQYHISIMPFCQSITQLKGMYPDDYEVVDQNCPFTIFLGGDENTNNEYFSKKLGMQTVMGMNNSVDNKKVNISHNADQRELMRPEELGRMPKSDMIVLIAGEQPIYDKKFAYESHPAYKYTNDYCNDIGLSDASVFKRDGFQQVGQGQIRYKLMSASAVPEILQFSAEALMAAFGTNLREEAEERMNRYNPDRHSYEEASIPGAF